MFILAALLCTTLELSSCETVIWPKETFPTEEACEKRVEEDTTVLNSQPWTMWKLYCYQVPGTEV